MSAWSDAPGEASPGRRKLLRAGLAGLLLGTGALPVWARIDEELAFNAVSFEEALHALGGQPGAADDIVMMLDEQVDNGAFVPVSIQSRLPGTQEIWIVCETNPNPLALRVSIPGGTEPFIATRIKVAESGRVHAVVRAQDRLYTVHRNTRVTVGGCA
jgi:sulfur-oxidizing protein SoxY